MPLYSFACEKCSHQFDDVRTVATRDDPTKCPKCKGKCIRTIAGLHTDKGYDKPMLSDALGVHPEQIAEAKQRFPHHEFAADGRMVIRSHQEFRRVLKDLGFRDHRSFY